MSFISQAMCGYEYRVGGSTITKVSRMCMQTPECVSTYADQTPSCYEKGDNTFCTKCTDSSGLMGMCTSELCKSKYCILMHAKIKYSINKISMFNYI